jgi:antitoxin component YwqK of YwqJK toxin-antitoxin module
MVRTTYLHGMIHGEYTEYYENGNIKEFTIFYQGKDLKVNPATLTEKDKTYIMLSGRLPPRD